jgi:hypothetical protein
MKAAQIVNNVIVFVKLAHQNSNVLPVNLISKESLTLLTDNVNVKEDIKRLEQV